MTESASDNASSVINPGTQQQAPAEIEDQLGWQPSVIWPIRPCMDFKVGSLRQ